MSSKKGKLRECDRCGATCFLLYAGTRSADGGYTTWDNFEEAPDGWFFQTGIGDLCPKCSAEYEETIAAFMKAGRQKSNGA